MKLYRTVLIFTFLLCSITGVSQIKLPALFSDNMILQQETEVPVWGWGDRNSEYKIQTSWNQESYSVKTDKAGKWRLKVSTPKAGGPFSITVKNNDQNKTIQNVMIGEVWICSGQSNM